MYKDKEILCVIPARGGSKRLPGKNIMELNGMPMIAYSIEAALGSEFVDRVIVSTDDEEIKEVALRFGAEVPFMRPAELGRDDSTSIDVLLHAVKWLEEKEGYTFDLLVLLQATSPLRGFEDVDSCVKMIADSGADNVISVTASHTNPYLTMLEIGEDGFARHFKESDYNGTGSHPSVFEINGAVYVWRKETINRERPFFLDKTMPYVMDAERSIDIDTIMDFKIAEMVLKGGSDGS